MVLRWRGSRPHLHHNTCSARADRRVPQKPRRSVLNHEIGYKVRTVNAPPGQRQHKLLSVVFWCIAFPEQHNSALRRLSLTEHKAKVIISLKLNFLELPLQICTIPVYAPKFTWNRRVILPTNQPQHQPGLDTFTRLSSLNVIKLCLPACADSANGVWENVPFKFNFH